MKSVKLGSSAPGQWVMASSKSRILYVPRRVNDSAPTDNVMLHGCHIADNSLVGTGAIVHNGAKIGRYSLAGPGALVTEGNEFPGSFADHRRPGASEPHSARWRRSRSPARLIITSSAGSATWLASSGSGKRDADFAFSTRREEHELGKRSRRGSRSAPKVTGNAAPSRAPCSTISRKFQITSHKPGQPELLGASGHANPNSRRGSDSLGR